MYGQTAPSELRDKFAMSIRQPVGVCSVITPWNFPMAIPSWKIVPALVCGNTVVFKPATLTPLSAVNFVRILEEAGVPRGVVNLVTGGGDEVGTVLTTAPEVRVVSFTGSTEVGRTVSLRAAPSFKKVHLEMGGKNVIIVMDDADLELALEGCLWGGFGTTGQRCTAASRVVVHEKGLRRRSSSSSPRARGRCGSATAWIRRPRWGRRSARASSRRWCATSRSAAPRAPGWCAAATRSTDGTLRDGLLPRADRLCRRARRRCASRRRRSSARWSR